MTSRRLLPAIVVLGLVAAACSHGGADGAGDGGTPSPVPASNATTAPGLPTTTNALPLVDVPTFDALLTSLKGTPVVVNVWASWCVPCKAEAPMLRAAAAANPDVQFLGVDILDSRDGAESFIEEQRIPYPSVFDPPGAIRTDLGSIGQPVTVFYDANGRQVALVDGQLSQSTLDQHLEQLAPAS